MTTTKQKTNPADTVHLSPVAFGVRLDSDACWVRKCVCGCDNADSDPTFNERPEMKKWSGQYTHVYWQVTCSDCAEQAARNPHLLDLRLSGAASDPEASPFPQQAGAAPMNWVMNDGGRAAAGFKGSANDCVVRAIAIALELPYKQVYEELNAFLKTNEKRRDGRRSSARTGVAKKMIRQFLATKGWSWTPTMHVGAGCTTHLSEKELPSGRLIVAVSRHVVAVIDGVIHDTFDPARDGTRCVYGYYKRAR